MFSDPPVRKSHRLAGHSYNSPGYYFVTICTKVRGEDILCAIVPPSPAAFSVGAAALGGPRVGPANTFVHPKITLTTAGEVVVQYIRNIDRVYHSWISVDSYVIMPDHIHLIVRFRALEGGPPRAAAPTSTLSDVINVLKGLTTKKIGYSVWQRGYYDHIIRNRSDLQHIRAYIQQNPSKWVAAKIAEGLI